jgi:hypothetical protein
MAEEIDHRPTRPDEFGARTVRHIKLGGGSNLD